MDFYSSLEKYILENNLFSKKDRLLIAVSGGVDSVVLAFSLFHLGYSIGIAHCNFQLRGRESEKDESFVRDFAHNLGIPFFFEKFSTIEIHKENSGSIQMVARELRYTLFEKIRLDNQYDYILTAHHQNDLLETVLLNLVRGTGLAGLHGILPKSGFVIRPLLFATKDQIEKFAEEKKLKWREDLSNQSNKYKRNLIRNKVIPTLKDINPAIEKTISNTSEQVMLSERFIINQFETQLPKICREEDGYVKINITLILENGDGLFLLQAILKKFNFSFTDSKSIFQSANSISGKMFYSVTHRLIKDRDYWIVYNLKPKPAINIYVDTEKKEIEVSEDFGLRFEKRPGGRENLDEIISSNVLVLDYDELKFPLLIRNWQVGDQFSPLGLKGSKKVSDYLTDLKINLFQKERTLLVETNGQISAVLPNRPSNQFSVTTRTTTLYIISINQLFA